MGIDSQYGHVTTERGTIGEDEPVFVIRGRDKSAPAAIEAYADEAQACGAAPDLIDAALRRADELAAWQRANPDLVRVPSLKPEGTQ